MDPLQTIIHTIVVGAFGLILGRMIHGRRVEIKAAIEEFRADLRSDGSGLRTEARGGGAGFRTEARSDI